MFHDSFAVKKFAELKKRYGFDILIETGTHQGHGAMNASRFCEVMTIEINPQFRNEAVVNWIESGYSAYADDTFGIKRIAATAGTPKISSFLGNSPVVLSHLLPRLKGLRIATYLDSHWGEYWPLLDELKVIKECGFTDSVIIIHDFKNPNHPEWKWDNHGGKDCCWEYVKDAVLAINPNYRLEYNTEADGNCIGIGYILPP